MPNEKTHADSLRLYLTGAASDGGAQAVDNNALGNFRSSTEVSVLGVSVTSPISNVTILYAAGENGVGSGTLAATAADTLAWTAPGDTQGASVTILNGETRILESAGTPNKFIRVTRTTAAALTGTATIALTDILNNAISLDNVSSAEATAGDNEYRGVCYKNENSIIVSGVTVYLKTLGTQRVSDSAQLSGSGSGTISTTGSFADWPDSGWCRITTNVPALREIIYYSSRTATSLTVPSFGRGRLGTSAGAGAATDTLDAVPGIRIGKEAPTGSSTTGNAQTIANEGAAPTGITWNTAITAAGGVVIGDLNAGAIYFLWIHREVPAGEVATPSVLNAFKEAFDAA